MGILIIVIMKHAYVIIQFPQILDFFRSDKQLTYYSIADLGLLESHGLEAMAYFMALIQSL
jgi:hypothetical protein